MLFSALFRKNIAQFSDEQLAQKVGEGDKRALAELFKRFAPLVNGVALKYVKNKTEADDLLMHVFEKLTDKLDRHDVNNFSSWIHTVTRNECLMFLRKQKRLTTDVEQTLLKQADDSPDTFAEKLEHEETLLKLEEEIEKLKPLQKQAIELFYLENRCYQEVAVMMEIELKKVKSLIQNGKRNLKIALDKK
jgi:RNA polymerase sigma factor (sigma-70 family)